MVKLTENQECLVNGGTKIELEKLPNDDSSILDRMGSTEITRHHCPHCNGETIHYVTVSGYVCKICGTVSS